VIQKRDAEPIARAHMEKEQELKVKESDLEAVESQLDIDHLKHQTLKNYIRGTGFITVLLM